MSRAFVREDDGNEASPPTYNLPDRNDPGFARAAAAALLKGAAGSDVASAEAATGIRWGDPALSKLIEDLRTKAEAAGDERLEQVAERYLRAAGGFSKP